MFAVLVFIFDVAMGLQVTERYLPRTHGRRFMPESSRLVRLCRGL